MVSSGFISLSLIFQVLSVGITFYKYSSMGDVRNVLFPFLSVAAWLYLLGKENKQKLSGPY